MALTCLLQVRKKCLGSVYHSPKIDIHQPFEVFIAHVIDGLTKADTGVIHDEVHFSMRSDGVFCVFIDSFPVTNINHMSADVDRVARQQFDSVVEAFPADIRNGQMASFFCQGNCRSLPDA